MEKQIIKEEDIRKIVTWFEDRIAFLESLPNYPEIREGVERLKETVEGFKGGFNDFTDDVLQGHVAAEG